IFTRRYFFPLISSFAMYRHLPSAKADNLQVADAVSQSVLCLPVYPGLSREDQERIISVIAEQLRQAAPSLQQVEP
ncbi:MAG TPA: aminotransferase, partial [Leclercia adecarboxylata]|nr:aminotransferase [Leclercia adecarboxylata]